MHLINIITQIKVAKSEEGFEAFLLLTIKNQVPDIAQKEEVVLSR